MDLSIWRKLQFDPTLCEKNDEGAWYKVGVAILKDFNVYDILLGKLQKSLKKSETCS